MRNFIFSMSVPKSTHYNTDTATLMSIISIQASISIQLVAEKNAVFV